MYPALSSPAIGIVFGNCLFVPISTNMLMAQSVPSQKFLEKYGSGPKHK